MSEKDNLQDADVGEADLLEFPAFSESHAAPSSIAKAKVRPSIEPREVSTTVVASPVVRSHSFSTLALPELPALPRENRARLQMQSPTRIFFYWSTADDPFRLLKRAISGPAGNYTLVLKLADLKRGNEEIIPIESQGTSWFDVEADREYRAEVGMYAVGRPFIRIMFSNTVRTPRRSPSTRLAESAEWRVSATQFSKTLEAAGYDSDAFDVVLAGDDPQAATAAAYSDFAEFLGTPSSDLKNIPADELRYALLTLASKMPSEGLRWQVGAELYALLQANAEKLDSERALSVLSQRFGIEASSMIEEEVEPAVFAASVINFPRRLRVRRHGPPENVSSHTALLP